LGGQQDRAGDQECGFLAVGCLDRQVGGAAQHHQGERAVRRIRDDQQVSASVTAADGHYVLAFVFPSWPVELGWSLQRWPVDVDGADVSEHGSQDRNKVG